MCTESGLNWPNMRPFFLTAQHAALFLNGPTCGRTSTDITLLDALGLLRHCARASPHHPRPPVPSRGLPRSHSSNQTGPFANWLTPCATNRQASAGARPLTHSLGASSARLRAVARQARRVASARSCWSQARDVTWPRAAGLWAPRGQLEGLDWPLVARARGPTTDTSQQREETQLN